MDLDILREMKFGPETVWTMKTNCPWCGGRLINHNEDSFKRNGNCCSKCNTHYGKIAIEKNHERQITQTDRIIKQTRLEMDTIAMRLDEAITEEERLEIVGKLERKFIQIKMLKGL